MDSSKWFKYDILLLILWTCAFVAGLLDEDGPTLLSYCLIYAGLVCELLKHITNHYFVSIRANRSKCNKDCRGTHECEECQGENCNQKDCNEY